MKCAYCETDTGGNHAFDCPNRNMKIPEGVLLEVTDTSPTPKVKDPKPEQGKMKLAVAVNWEDPECDPIAAVRQLQEIVQNVLDKEINQ